MKKALSGLAAQFVIALPASTEAPTFPTDDPVIRAIWEQGMGAGSQAYDLAQALTDHARLSQSEREQPAVSALNAEQQREAEQDQRF